MSEKPKHRYTFINEGEKFVDLVVYVKTRQQEEKIAIEEGELVFYTKEPPIAGRANASLLNFLSRSLRIPTSRIEIIYGKRDRTKTVRIYDVKIEDIVKRIEEVIQKENKR